MRHCETGKLSGKFDVLTATRLAQGAVMTLAPGGSSDDEPRNEHPRSEQWLFVVRGSGVAELGRDSRRRVPLKPGTLLIIERGEAHNIKNTGRGPLKTINVYVPPAYRRDGRPRSTVKRAR